MGASPLGPNLSPNQITEQALRAGCPSPLGREGVLPPGVE